jgi:cytochrome P450
VRSNILTFIAAGHETTANTLSWTTFLLSQSPEWREQVQAEVDRDLIGPAPGIADRLVETRAVIEETIRLYPPIAAINRVALDGDDLNGERVRPGSLIVISLYVLHRHCLLWDCPMHSILGAFSAMRARRSIDLLISRLAPERANASALLSSFRRRRWYWPSL